MTPPCWIAVAESREAHTPMGLWRHFSADDSGLTSISPFTIRHAQIDAVVRLQTRLERSFEEPNEEGMLWNLDCAVRLRL